MKILQAVTVLVIITVMFATGCKSEKPLQFCEGVTSDGKPAQCGSTFTTGDLTGVLTLKEAPGAEAVTIDILEKKDFSSQPYNSYTHKIDPDNIKITFPISLYREGTFIVEILQGKSKLAEGELKIVDTY
ncbi:MAG: hypothetical protein ACOCWZ_08050 [Spirochaetota bacterium]